MMNYENHPLNYLDVAKRVFEGTKYQASKDDIKHLAENIRLLDERGLNKLNRRLIDGGRKIWDSFSEHNFAAMLISYHSDKIPISYEPDEGLRRPPDFKVVIGGIKYWVQMKRLSNLERENRQDKIVQQIKRGCENIGILKFFSCKLSDTFTEYDVPNFLKFLGKHAENTKEGSRISFTDNRQEKAIIEFWSPKNIELTHLTLGTAGDKDVVEISGRAKEQIKQSLINAAGAFDWNLDQNNMNLIAMDADKKEDIDICDAVFGTEFDFFRGNRHSWSRQNDGFFHEDVFINKVAGVIAMKRKEWKPVSNYYLMLFVNDIFKDRPEALNKLLSFDKVIFYDTRPPMGYGNFKLP